MSDDKCAQLVRMANQIALNLGHVGSEGEAVIAVADHIARFWAKAMRTQIQEYLHRDDEALDPLARQALLRLERP